MGSSGQRTLSSAYYALGQQRLKVSLVKAVVKHAEKPYRVHVKHSDGDQVLASGHTGCHNTEDEARETYDWTCEEALKRGWGPGPKRGGGRVRMLASVPAPIARPGTTVGKPAAAAPAPPLPTSRLMAKASAATRRTA